MGRIFGNVGLRLLHRVVQAVLLLFFLLLVLNLFQGSFSLYLGLLFDFSLELLELVVVLENLLDELAVALFLCLPLSLSKPLTSLFVHL